jgi:hypothetical protein
MEMFSILLEQLEDSLPEFVKSTRLCKLLNISVDNDVEAGGVDLKIQQFTKPS